jgi:methylmalonyl-CoA mutase N-terminal domain/subunit
VDRLGGSVRAIDKGYIQSKIRESAFKQQMEIESGVRKIVGVNILKDTKPHRITIHRIDPRSVKKQITSVKAFKKKRARMVTERALRKLRDALDNERNLIPFIIEAVRGKATTGEISDAVRETYGEFHPKTIV